MPKILVIRNNGITAEINQEEGQTTEFLISGFEPITLLHEAHFETLKGNVCSLSGRSLTDSEFLAMIGIADSRSQEPPKIG